MIERYRLLIFICFWGGVVFLVLVKQLDHKLHFEIVATGEPLV